MKTELSCHNGQEKKFWSNFIRHTRELMPQRDEVANPFIGRVSIQTSRTELKNANPAKEDYQAKNLKQSLGILHQREFSKMSPVTFSIMRVRSTSPTWIDTVDGLKLNVGTLTQHHPESLQHSRASSQAQGSQTESPQMVAHNLTLENLNYCSRLGTLSNDCPHHTTLNQTYLLNQQSNHSRPWWPRQLQMVTYHPTNFKKGSWN